MRQSIGVSLCIVSILFASRGVVFAQDTWDTDCSFLWNVNPELYAQSVVKSIEDDEKPALKIFENKDMSVALSHMKQYCCSQKLLAEDSCSWVERAHPYYPESPYIFDHLMYVWMKKMDGIQQDCDVLWMSCETREYDVDPVERRQFITEVAQNTKWFAPWYLLAKFKEARWDETSYWDSEKPTMFKAFDRMCQDAVSIRYAVNVPQNVIKDWNQSGSSLAALCRQVTAERYTQEATYVRTLQIEKWTKFLVDNLKAYLNEYFINKRMADLVGKYAELDGCFSMVSRYVDKTAQCNQ